jgi:hypothetical protein
LHRLATYQLHRARLILGSLWQDPLDRQGLDHRHVLRTDAAVTLKIDAGNRRVLLQGCGNSQAPLVRQHVVRQVNLGDGLAFGDRRGNNGSRVVIQLHVRQANDFQGLAVRMAHRGQRGGVDLDAFKVDILEGGAGGKDGANEAVEGQLGLFHLDVDELDNLQERVAADQANQLVQVIRVALEGHVVELEDVDLDGDLHSQALHVDNTVGVSDDHGDRCGGVERVREEREKGGRRS